MNNFKIGFKFIQKYKTKKNKKKKNAKNIEFNSFQNKSEKKVFITMLYFVFIEIFVPELNV